MRSKLMRPLLAALVVLGMAGGLTACGDTWHGLKKDTSQNLDKAGRAVD